MIWAVLIGCGGLLLICVGILVMKGAMMADDLMLGFWIAVGGGVVALAAGAQLAFGA